MAEAAAIAGPAPSKLLAPDGNIPPPESAGLGTAGTYGSRWLAAKGAGVTSVHRDSTELVFAALDYRMSIAYLQEACRPNWTKELDVPPK